MEIFIGGIIDRVVGDFVRKRKKSPSANYKEVFLGALGGIIIGIPFNYSSIAGGWTPLVFFSAVSALIVLLLARQM